MEGLQLAANVIDGADEHIDILLGGDQYSDIVIVYINRGEQGLVTIKTTQGWVLSGSTGNSGGDSNVVSVVIDATTIFSYIGSIRSCQVYV